MIKMKKLLEEGKQEEKRKDALKNIEKCHESLLDLTWTSQNLYRDMAIGWPNTTRPYFPNEAKKFQSMMNDAVKRANKAMSYIEKFSYKDDFPIGEIK